MVAFNQKKIQNLNYIKLNLQNMKSLGESDPASLQLWSLSFKILAEMSQKL